MASVLIEELKTVATEAKKSQNEDAVGSSWAALAMEEDPQRREIGTLLAKAGAGEGGRGGEGREMGGGVGQREQWEDPLTIQPDWEIEPSLTNRGVGGVCLGIVPRVQSELSRALHAHRGKKLLQDLRTQESAPTKRAMVSFRGAREKGAMEFVECLGVSQEDTMEGPLWRETLRKSLGSHDAAELVGGSVMAMVAGKKAPASTPFLAQRQDGALSLSIGCSTRHWLDPFARVKSSLLLKIHGPSERELSDKTAERTRYVWTSQRRRGLSLTTTLDSRIWHFYSKQPSSTLAPAPIWGMQHAM